MTTQTFSNEGPLNAHLMQSDCSTSSAQLWAGRIVTASATLFMLMDGIMKILKPAAVLEANVRLGYPVGTLSPLCQHR